LAKTNGKDFLSEYPEINLARRVLKKFEVSPPIDIFALVKRYARIEILHLPLDIDGVSFNLKIPGRQPVVVLNDTRPPRRKRFTLAHELGHVLIPWHIGTILDEIDLSDHGRDLSYWELENEANRFAGELLMPRTWVENLIITYKNPCDLVACVTEIANVSADAALIRVKQILGPGYVYALVDDAGFVISSGRSADTLAAAPQKGHYLDKDAIFPASESRWESRAPGGMWLWWHFANETELPMSSDERDWRKILEGILLDLHLDPSTSMKVKQTINGIVGYVNGLIGRDLHRSTPEGLYAASMQRFSSRAIDNPIIREFVAHPDFPIYLAKRTRSFGER
jgi:Zn-dependent peptidase ImmA (M78 family)